MQIIAPRMRDIEISIYRKTIIATLIICTSDANSALHYSKAAAVLFKSARSGFSLLRSFEINVCFFVYLIMISSETRITAAATDATLPRHNLSYECS
jgi:hypothetical protein